MAVVCHNCGGENEEGREWCSRCGAPLDAPVASSPAPAAPARPRQQPQAPASVSAAIPAPPGPTAKAVAGQVLAPRAAREAEPRAARPPAGEAASPGETSGFIPGAEPIGGPAAAASQEPAPDGYTATAGMTGAMAMPPYMPYGYGFPFSGFPWWAYMMPPFYPPFPMFYPGAFPGFMPFSPFPYQQGGPAAYPFGAPARRMRPLYIVLIIIGVLLIIGGAVTSAVLLAGGSGKSSFNLGDASVSGANIEFTDMTIKQDGSALTLSGSYDNSTKKEGYVAVPVRAASNGSTQTLTFTVPVQVGRSQAFTQTDTSSARISSATLGTLTFSSSKGSDYNGTDYSPFDSTTPTTPTTPRNQTTPYDE